MSERISDRIARLVAVHEKLRLSEDPDMLAHAKSLDGYLRGLHPSLDAAFGLKTEPGGRKPATVLRVERVHTLLRQEAIDRGVAGQPIKVQAETLRKVLIHYEAHGWLRDLSREEPPKKDAGLWEIMRASHGQPPRSFARLWQILSEQAAAAK